MSAEPIDLTSGNTQNQSAVTLLITAGIFFGLGFVTAFLIFGVANNSDTDPASVQAAVQETFEALTPPATAIPTNVPVSETFTASNPVLGPEDAPITIVEFSDYLCPYCGRFHIDTLDPLLEHYDGLVRFVYREYPIIGGQTSVAVGAAAQCANLQGKYWPYADLIWENQTSSERQAWSEELLMGFAEQIDLGSTAFTACLEDESGVNVVIADYEQGREYNITGTPTFFINGEKLVGAQPFENFRQVIDRQLREQGIEPPA